jgi:periplasmic protein TonB
MTRNPRLRFLVLIMLVFSGAADLTMEGAEEKTMPVSEKDLRAAAVRRVEPEYPAVARQIRLAGDVELEIVVDEAGNVEKVKITRGNTLLTGPSIQAIRKWKFKPFGPEGQPAKAAGPIRFNFQM